jgi:hypothetical protein
MNTPATNIVVPFFTHVMETVLKPVSFPRQGFSVAACACGQLCSTAAMYALVPISCTNI